MDTKIAQKRVDDISAAMVAKGMRQPDAKFSLNANRDPQVYLTWIKGFRGERVDGGGYKFFNGGIAEVFEEATKFITEQPDAETAKLHDFMAALGSVIDIGKQHGIEADYLNPLVASMKKLSSNILTHGDQHAA